MPSLSTRGRKKEEEEEEGREGKRK